MFHFLKEAIASFASSWICPWISALKDFANFTLKYLWWSFFLIELQFWRLSRCFPMNIPKFLRTPFFTEHLWWLFLHCTGHYFVQSWPKQSKTKFCRLFSFKIIDVYSGSILHKCAQGQYCILPQTYLDNIEYTIFLCNVFLAW